MAIKAKTRMIADAYSDPFRLRYPGEDIPTWTKKEWGMCKIFLEKLNGDAVFAGEILRYIFKNWDDLSEFYPFKYSARPGMDLITMHGPGLCVEVKTGIIYGPRSKRNRMRGGDYDHDYKSGSAARVGW